MFCVHACTHHVGVWCPRSPEEGIRYPRTGVKDRRAASTLKTAEPSV